MHDLPLITTLAAAFTSAWFLGLLTQRLGLSPIVGYLLGGVLIGPNTPGFVGDVELAHQLAEVGVILLMFGVGLHFNLKELLAVKGVAIPGAVGQSLAATLVSMGVFWALGMPLKTGAVLGMAMAVASTVVLIRVLMDAGTFETPQGHIAVGWLLVEDVLTVIVLVLIPMMGDHGGSEAGGPGLLVSVVIALLKLVALVGLVMLGGSKVIPWALVQVARLRSRELFTLTVLVFSVAIAAASYYFFGASMALGAFLAGMVVAQSPVSHQAAADALPMRDAFSVLFFVSIGMLLDPRFLIEQPLQILAALGIILVVKPVSALVIVALLGRSSRTALTAALALAQIGEFSFIVAQLARHEGLIPESGMSLLVAASIITITLNPIIFRAIDPIEKWLARRPRLWSLMNRRAERRAREANGGGGPGAHPPAEAGGRLAILAGYGPVGRSVHRLLQEAGLRTLVIETNMETVAQLKAQGQPTIFGDASRASILEQAGVERATHLILALPQGADRAAAVVAARSLNPSLRILVRAHYLREREDLEHAGATAAVFEEAEAAVALARLVLADTGANREAAERTVRDLRLRLIRENVSNLGSQKVRGVMVPWPRVQKLIAGSPRREILSQVARLRYSRWPVVEAGTGRPLGYLLARDLIAETGDDDGWSSLIRPIRSARPDDDVESTLVRLQQEGATICLVEDRGSPVGIITVEDILERVVGRIEDEYPRQAKLSLATAVAHGAVVLDLEADTPERAIRELASALPSEHIPPGTRVADLALARELDAPTDLGVGVAAPHARCPSMAEPLVAFGRSSKGIAFSHAPAEPVRLIFLLATPAEGPGSQVLLLGQLARVAGNRALREKLLAAATPEEVQAVLFEAERVIEGQAG